MAKRVKTKWVITIPDGAKVLISEGQEVKADEDILEVTNGGEKILDVSDKFRGLSPIDKAKLMEKLPGMKIVADEIIFKTKGIFSKKIIFPINGEVIKIDEFDNLHFREVFNKVKKISCPVEAVVVKKDEKVVELEFKAIEYEGKGINEGKAWGIKGLGFVGNMMDLSFKDADKILLTESLHRSWLIKAEVVGVKGVVVISSNVEEENDRIDSKLPILAVEKKEWQELRERVDEVKKAMINATNGRLLLVV